MSKRSAELGRVVGAAMAAYLEKRSFLEMLSLSKRCIVFIQALRKEEVSAVDFQPLIENSFFVLLSQTSSSPPSLHHVAVELYRNTCTEGLVYLNSDLSPYAELKCSTLTELLLSIGSETALSKNLQNVVNWSLGETELSQSATFLPIRVVPVLALSPLSRILGAEKYPSVLLKLREYIKEISDFEGNGAHELSIYAAGEPNRKKVDPALLTIVQLCVNTINGGMDKLGSSVNERSETPKAEDSGKGASDVEVVMAECFNILSQISSLDEKFFTSQAFQAVKVAFSRLAASQNTTLYILTRALCLLLDNYSSYQLTLDITSIVTTFFQRCTREIFENLDQNAAFELVNFCLERIDFLMTEGTADTVKSFIPTILSTCVLDPFLVDDVSKLLPMVIEHDTSVEIMHRLIDMPFQSLLAERRDMMKDDEVKPFMEYLFAHQMGTPPPHTSIEHRKNHRMERILRTDRLDTTPCCSVSLFLLAIFFEVFCEGDEEQLEVILPHLIRRYELMEISPSVYGFRVNSQLVRSFTLIIKRYPKALVTVREEIARQLLPAVRITASLLVYHACWAIGELGALGTSSVPVNEILGFFEPLETYVHELLANLRDTKLYQSEREYYERLFVVCIFSLARCGASVMDIAPRAVLVIQKIASSSGVTRVVADAANEAVLLLSKSGMASVLLKDEIPQITDPTMTTSCFIRFRSIDAKKIHIFDK